MWESDGSVLYISYVLVDSRIVLQIMYHHSPPIRKSCIVNACCNVLLLKYQFFVDTYILSSLC